MMDKLNATDGVGAAVHRGAALSESMNAIGRYDVTCVRPLKEYEGEYLRLLGIAMAWDKIGKERLVERFLEQARELPHQIVWEDTIHNTVCTAGKNLALDTFLAGSSYTVVGPYIGLISSTSYSAIAAGDTQASHSGWLEAGNANAPTYTSPRKTAAWSAASAGSKALSSNASFAITGSGTVKGAFMIYGSGALTTIDNTAGTLLSAGLFTGGDKVVANLDTLNVSYSLAI
jgi:hypothetical protein